MRFFIVLIALVPIVILSAQTNDGIIIDSISSQIIDEVVEYKVYLPASYNTYKASKKYPTIIVLDKGDMFNLTKTYVEFLSKTGKIPESIVVGLSSSNRIRDFTPTQSFKNYEGEQIENYSNSGGAENYISFMEKELMDKIADEYRVNGYDLLIGHSLSGLFAAYAVINSELIDAFILIDPSTWWDNQKIVEVLKGLEGEIKNNKFVFVSSAGNLLFSDEMKRMKDSQTTFYNVLKEKGFSESNLNFSKYDYETHGSVPLRTILDGVEWMYSGYLVDDMKHRSSEEIISNFKIFDDKLGFHFPPLEPMISWLASTKRNKKDYEGSLKLTQLNIDNYPDSWKSFYNRGLTYQEISNFKEARKDYDKGLELDPGNTAILQRIDELSKE